MTALPLGASAGNGVSETSGALPATALTEAERRANIAAGSALAAASASSAGRPLESDRVTPTLSHPFDIPNEPRTNTADDRATTQRLVDLIACRFTNNQQGNNVPISDAEIEGHLATLTTPAAREFALYRALVLNLINLDSKPQVDILFNKLTDSCHRRHAAIKIVERFVECKLEYTDLVAYVSSLAAPKDRDLVRVALVDAFVGKMSPPLSKPDVDRNLDLAKRIYVEMEDKTFFNNSNALTAYLTILFARAKNGWSLDQLKTYPDGLPAHLQYLANSTIFSGLLEAPDRLDDALEICKNDLQSRRLHSVLTEGAIRGWPLDKLLKNVPTLSEVGEDGAKRFLRNTLLCAICVGFESARPSRLEDAEQVAFRFQGAAAYIERAVDWITDEGIMAGWDQARVENLLNLILAGQGRDIEASLIAIRYAERGKADEAWYFASLVSDRSLAPDEQKLQRLLDANSL